MNGEHLTLEDQSGEGDSLLVHVDTDQPRPRHRQTVWLAVSAACFMAFVALLRPSAVQRGLTEEVDAASLVAVGEGAGRALIIVVGHYAVPNYNRGAVAQSEVAYSMEIAQNLNCEFRVLTNADNASVDVGSGAVSAFVDEHRAWLGEGDFGVLLLAGLSGHGRSGMIFGSDMWALKESALEAAYEQALGAKPKLFFYNHVEAKDDPDAPRTQPERPESDGWIPLSSIQSNSSLQNSFRLTATAPDSVSKRAGSASPFLHSCARATRLCLKPEGASILDIADAIRHEFLDLTTHVLQHETLQTPQLEADLGASMRRRICVGDQIIV